jgi:hypothetical protein
MLKKLLVPAALLFAVLVPAAAKADYVCETQYYPGSIARIKLMLTASANCTGATKTLWVCEPTNPSTSCGVLRYSVPELLNLQSNLVSAADTQQVVLASWTTCTGAPANTANCLNTVTFRQ